MAVVLAMAAAVLLVVAAAVGPDNPSPWFRAVFVLCSWVGPILLLACVGWLLRRRVGLHLQRLLVEIAGPALIRSMPPRTVFASALSRVFGDDVGHEDVITGLLGGAGRDSSGRDTVVSRNTSAHVRLRSIGEDACHTESTWTHEFSGVQDNHLYFVFATCNPAISSLVTSERMFPLFELWSIADEDQLEAFIPRLRRNLRVGIVYRDEGGHRHVVNPTHYDGEEVALRHYDRYVRLPDSVDRRDLRIVRLDLHDLADPDHVVGAVEQLTLMATNVAPADLSYYIWSPPHPCYVRSITFDVTELERPGEQLVYLLMSSTIRRAGLPFGGWTRSDGKIDVVVDSWMIPGHGVTLLWRPTNGSDVNASSDSG
jgi:hypothetical protein